VEIDGKLFECAGCSTIGGTFALNVAVKQSLQMQVRMLHRFEIEDLHHERKDLQLFGEFKVKRSLDDLALHRSVRYKPN
jgi:hypothetical protein